MPPPLRVGEYEILGEIGRGGMGVVYRARHVAAATSRGPQDAPGRLLCRPRSSLRFRAEAEAVARLQHPNIVQIFEIGEHRGETGPPCPYLCFEFVEGGNLAERLTDALPAPGQAAAWLDTLARRGSCGPPARDHSPRSEAGQRLAEPRRRAQDLRFRRGQADDRLRLKTLSGMLVGTAEYMAPEQAEREARLVGPATDIYALGVMLYQLLTGQAAVPGVTAPWRLLGR